LNDLWVVLMNKIYFQKYYSSEKKKKEYIEEYIELVYNFGFSEE